MLVLPSFFLQYEWPSCLETERGTIDIVWSCASTVVLSAWVTARPNVVPQSNARWEHLKLIAAIIIAPELILLIAVKQLYSAILFKFLFKGN